MSEVYKEAIIKKLSEKIIQKYSLQEGLHAQHSEGYQDEIGDSISDLED